MKCCYDENHLAQPFPTKRKKKKGKEERKRMRKRMRKKEKFVIFKYIAANKQGFSVNCEKKLELKIYHTLENN